MATDIVLKDRNGEDVTYSGIETVTFDTPTEGVQTTFTHGVLMEGVTIAANFANGDQAISVPDGYLVKEATIAKPAALVPENIRAGTEIAGVVGELIGDTEEVTVDLDMTDGNQVIEPSADGKVLSKVTITKPETLISENIAEGVDIGGVVGSLTGGKGTTKEIEPDFSGGNQTVTAGEDELWDEVVIKQPESLKPENIKNGENVGGVVGTLAVPDTYVEFTLNASKEIIAAKLVGFTKIPAGCFAYMDSLTSVDISGSPGITSIGAYAFRECSKLTNFAIPNTVTSIGNYAFYNCDTLTSIVIPDTTTSIGNYAFSQCSGVTSIIIGSGVTSIGANAFQSCNATKTATFRDTTSWYVGSSAGAKTTSVSVTNTTTNVNYLINGYAPKYWTKV